MFKDIGESYKSFINKNESQENKNHINKVNLIYDVRSDNRLNHLNSERIEACNQDSSVLN